MRGGSTPFCSSHCLFCFLCPSDPWKELSLQLPLGKASQSRSAGFPLCMEHKLPSGTFENCAPGECFKWHRVILILPCALLASSSAARAALALWGLCPVMLVERTRVGQQCQEQRQLQYAPVTAVLDGPNGNPHHVPQLPGRANQAVLFMGGPLCLSLLPPVTLL